MEYQREETRVGSRDAYGNLCTISSPDGLCHSKSGEACIYFDEYYGSCKNKISECLASERSDGNNVCFIEPYKHEDGCESCGSYTEDCHLYCNK